MEPVRHGKWHLRTAVVSVRKLCPLGVGTTTKTETNCMLVLTRKDHQAILMLDENGRLLARVVPVKTSTGKVRLGIEAPSDIKVLREELRPVWDTDSGKDTEGT